MKLEMTCYAFITRVLANENVGHERETATKYLKSKTLDDLINILFFLLVVNFPCNLYYQLGIAEFSNESCNFNLIF